MMKTLHNFTQFVVLLSLPLLLWGCGGDKKEPVAEVKPVEEVPVNPNLKYEIKGDAATITGCDKKASGALIIPVTIEGKLVVTSIGQQAFRRCTSLTSITIPESVSIIGSYAFLDCRNLTSITIGNGVTSIGKGAFLKCRNLTSITIPASVTSIGERAFMDCNSLTSIEVGAGNVNYASVNGVLFNAEKAVLLTYPASKTGANYTIPDSVTLIEAGAFQGCRGLTSITIPDSVSSIEDLTFGGCHSLTNITIPDGVTSIGELAFTGCESLTSITIPDGVTSIGKYAFSWCPSLTAVTFLGDAPKASNYVFEKATPTIYRKPEAKGWGDTWGGRPVKLISEKP